MHGSRWRLVYFPRFHVSQRERTEEPGQGRNETRDEQLLNVRGDQCHGIMLKADLFNCADLTPGPHLMICLKSQAMKSRVEQGQS